MFGEEELLALSGLQHFLFCRRQWALIHIENQWKENLRTTEGNLMHERVHDERQSESRGDLLVVRGLRIRSSKLGASGQCDVVEFCKAKDGISLHDWGAFGVYFRLNTSVVYRKQITAMKHSFAHRRCVLRECLGRTFQREHCSTERCEDVSLLRLMTNSEVW